MMLLFSRSKTLSNEVIIELYSRSELSLFTFETFPFGNLNYYLISIQDDPL